MSYKLVLFEHNTTLSVTALWVLKGRDLQARMQLLWFVLVIQSVLKLMQSY